MGDAVGLGCTPPDRPGEAALPVLRPSGCPAARPYGWASPCAKESPSQSSWMPRADAQRHCVLTQVTSVRRADAVLLSGANQREGLAGAVAGSIEAAGAQPRAVRAEPTQLLPEKAPERLLWPAFNYGCTWRCQDGILWPMVVHRARLACTMVAGARSGRKNEGLYVMYFQYVICICGTGDNLCIPLPEGTVIPLPEGTVKITLENPAPLLAGPDRAWSPGAFARVARGLF